MDTEKMIEAKKFLAKLVEDRVSLSENPELDIAKELYQILGKFTPNWVIYANPEYSDWAMTLRSTNLDKDEERFEFTNMLDYTKKEEWFIDGFLVKSEMKEAEKPKEKLILPSSLNNIGTLITEEIGWGEL